MYLNCIQVAIKNSKSALEQCNFCSPNFTSILATVTHRAAQPMNCTSIIYHTPPSFKAMPSPAQHSKHKRKEEQYKRSTEKAEKWTGDTDEVECTYSISTASSADSTLDADERGYRQDKETEGQSTHRKYLKSQRTMYIKCALLCEEGFGFLSAIWLEHCQAKKSSSVTSRK